MNEQQALKRKIHEIDFALHELNLFLDTNPDSEKAMALLKSYREMKNETEALYEAKFGPYIVSPCDAPAKTPYGWIEGPWPWENMFYKGE